MFRTLFVALFALVLVTPVFADGTPGKVTIYRDNWGVPYIFAATDEDAAFGMGYAQAEDRLADMYINVRTALGRMAEAFGKEHVESDYFVRVARIPERCEKYYGEAPEHITKISDAFIRGVNKYEADHPDKKPEFALELQGWHLGAIGQTMISRWPLGQIQDELKNTQNSKDFGSNEWSVAPKRTADGRAILLTDPHLTWEGMAVFYEANVWGKDLDMHGFFLVGSPFVALGNNGHVGWAATTGGPDTADVYQITQNPQSQLQYEYDGEFRQAQMKFLSIPVKGEAQPVSRPAGYTHLGPLFTEPKDGKAFVGASPYLEERLGITEQFYAMCKAKNADEFYGALAMNQYMEQNIMYADRSGTIGYVRTGRVPIRPEGYDWLKAVPGNTSKTAWKGIHDIKDLVQIKDPAQGYMQNCNISPQFMMLDSPMTPDKYPAYIFNVSWDTQNTRGQRALDVLSADDSVTVDEAKALALDVHDVMAPAWHKALDDAVAAVGAERMKDAKFAGAVKTLLAWDAQFVKDSKAAPIVKFWRDKAIPKIDNDALLAKKPLSKENQEALLQTLYDTLTEMNTTYGKDVTWGDIWKVGRSGKMFPVDGAVLGNGRSNTRTLFNVSTKELKDQKGVYLANSGSMSICLMFFAKDGIEAYTCIPWGQSLDPNSPHHVDQGEKLYAKRQFKQVWMSEAALKPHVEYTLVLETM
ncbi:MAG: penicillin acylase family protein [Candidatus Hydrogenedentota bacterium]